ncbi:MAG: hypothetical protein U0521_19180 [Anaerolineae bacterium]
MQLAVIAQFEHRHRREALGHRGDAKHAVRGDRRPRFDILDADAPGKDEFTIDDDAIRHAGDMVLSGEVPVERFDFRKDNSESGSIRVIELSNRKHIQSQQKDGSNGDIISAAKPRGRSSLWR